MNRKQWLKDYFTFTRKERIGLLIIVVLILAIWISPKIIFKETPHTVSADSSWIIAALKLQHEEGKVKNGSSQKNEDSNELAYDKPSKNHSANSTGELFYFDPNTLSFGGWKKLGMREKIITTIQKYVSRGGHFYKPEDLKKIYGIHSGEYSRLEPYIKIETISSKINDHFVTAFKKDQASNNRRYNAVDINTADTSAFIALPGIGNRLASRIVNFRDKLGGFYSIDQVGETYALPDSTFQKIRQYLLLKDVTVKKLNINSATKDELKSHPYIRWNLANAIVEYRNQHGNFSSLEELKKISLITDEIYNRIVPYLMAQ